MRTTNLISFSLISALLVLSTSPAWAQPTLSISSPQTGTCIPNDPPLQPGGAPGDIPEFLPSNVPLTFTVTEPTGADLTLSASVNGVPVTLSANTVFPEGPNIPTFVEFISILGDSIQDGQGLVLTLTVNSPAGQTTDTVSFDLDRVPPLLQFNDQQLGLLNACVPNASIQLGTIIPTASDLFDANPQVTFLDSEQGCVYTRVITAIDHCGSGNRQEVIFQIKRPAIDPPDIYFSGVDEGEFYLETNVYFGVFNDSCYETTGTLTQDDGVANPVTNGAYLNVPGSYRLAVDATDCAGSTLSDQVSFEILEQPYAETGGPYEIQQGQLLILDGGQSFSPAQLGGIIEYAWDFNLLDDGDGGYRYLGERVDFLSYEGVPFDDGVYQVGLRIETASGEIRYDNTQVTVLDAPPNCVIGGPYEVQQGVFLTFDGSGSSPGIEEEPIIGYQWDFGEFESPLDERFGLSLSQPEYFYSSEGEYTVSLTVYDIDSVCTVETTVTVNDIDPIVRNLNIASPPPYREGATITFSAGTTTAGSPAEPITRFIWDWGDASPQTLSPLGVELRRPEHTFTEDGTFNVCLTVQDEDSDASDCIEIEVEDLRPIARISGDLFAIEGDSADFSIVARAGGVADPVSYALIQWGDGTETRLEAEELNANQTDVTHVFVTDGDLTIRLLVFDEEEADPSIAEIDIYVDDVRPTPQFTTLSPEEGVETEWSAAQSQPGADSDPIEHYEWDWGDGSTSTGVTATHAYADNGSYLIRLTVTDSDGSPSTLSRFITVRNRAPYNTEIIAERTRFDFGERVRFEVNFSDVPSDTVSIFWRMGSGNATYTNQRIVEHEYRELGIFTIRVLLTDDDGGETTVELDVEVTPAGPRIIAGTPPAVSEGELMSFEVELRAAESAEGGVDGPVELRVLRAPRGMTWTQLETPNQQLSNRYRFDWWTSSDDGGLHPFKIRGTSPSGIERFYEVPLVVEEAQNLILSALGGDLERSTLSLFRYQADTDTQHTSLQRYATVHLGRGVGQLTEARGRSFISVPLSGAVAVVNTLTGELLRRVPVKGEPLALTSLGDYIWVFDGRRNQLTAIDLKLKVYRRTYVSGLEGHIVATQGLSTPEGDVLIALSSLGELWVLNPEALISNQPSRAVIRRLQIHGLSSPPSLNGDLISTPSGGGLLLEEEGDIIVFTPRGFAAFSRDFYNEQSSTPLWILRSAASVTGLTRHQGQLWATTTLGLRRFPIPEEGSGLEGERSPVSGVILDLGQFNTLVSFPSTLMGEPTIITATRRQVTHLSSSSLRSMLTTPDANPTSLAISTRNNR